MMLKSSDKPKPKLNRHDMRKILRKNPRYRWEYYDKNDRDIKCEWLDFMRLSCELCRKHVATIHNPNIYKSIVYGRYTQFQVICYDCYNTKLEYKKDGISTLQQLMGINNELIQEVFRLRNELEHKSSLGDRVTKLEKDISIIHINHHFEQLGKYPYIANTPLMYKGDINTEKQNGN